MCFTLHYYLCLTRINYIYDEYVQPTLMETSVIPRPTNHCSSSSSLNCTSKGSRASCNHGNYHRRHGILVDICIIHVYMYLKYLAVVMVSFLGMRGPCTCRSLSISTNCFCQAMFIMDPKVTGSWFDPIPQKYVVLNLCQNLVINFVAHEKVYLSRIICVFFNNKFIQVT